MASDASGANPGERIQRCYGCYTGFYLQEMWQAEDGSYYCEDCRDESMIPFEEFAHKL